MAAQVMTKKCHLCSNEGTLFCYECKNALCSSCRSKHDRIPVLKKHTIAKLQNVNVSMLNFSTRCSTHDQDYAHFCSTCSQLACSKCVTSTHKDHRFQEISEIADSMRNFSKNAITKTGKQIEDLKMMRENILSEHSTVQSEIQSKKNMITEIQMSMNKILESLKNNKITEFLDFEHFEKQRYQEAITDIDTSIEMHEQIKAELENGMTEQHDLLFYQIFSKVKTDYMKLDDEVQDLCVHRKKVPDFDKDKFAKEAASAIAVKFDISYCDACNEHANKLGLLEGQLHQCHQKYRAESQELMDGIKRLQFELSSKKQEVSKANKLKEDFEKKVLSLQEENRKLRMSGERQVYPEMNGRRTSGEEEKYKTDTEKETSGERQVYPEMNKRWASGMSGDRQVYAERNRRRTSGEEEKYKTLPDTDKETSGDSQAYAERYRRRISGMSGDRQVYAERNRRRTSGEEEKYKILPDTDKESAHCQKKSEDISREIKREEWLSRECRHCGGLMEKSESDPGVGICKKCGRTGTIPFCVLM